MAKPALQAVIQMKKNICYKICLKLRLKMLFEFNIYY